MYSVRRTLPFGFLFAGVLLAVAGCKPDYPACETGQGLQAEEFLCSTECERAAIRATVPLAPVAAWQVWRHSRSAPIVRNARRSGVRPQSLPAVLDRQRLPVGLRCSQGQCSKPQCTKDDDCAQDQECRQRPAAWESRQGTATCPLSPVYFRVRSSVADQRGDQHAQRQRRLPQEGHQPETSISWVGPDSRGTTEYNMACRTAAQAVKAISSAWASPVGRSTSPAGALDGHRYREASWAKDRAWTSTGSGGH